MGHWPTLAASTTLAAFVAAGALIYLDGAPIYVGLKTPQAERWAVAGADGADSTTPAHQGLAASTETGSTSAKGLHSGAMDLPSVSGAVEHPSSTRSGQDAGQTVQSGDPTVAMVLPAGVAKPGFGSPIPVTMAPLPPLPPHPPAATGAGPASQATAPLPPPVPPPVGLPARMAVAMPLSIPQLGPLDPARISGAARELAETVHLLASAVSDSQAAAEQAAADARKEPDGCAQPTGPRPASYARDLCDKAGF